MNKYLQKGEEHKMEIYVKRARSLPRKVNS